MISNEAREAAVKLLGRIAPDGIMEGRRDSLSVIQALQSVIDAERERCVAVAKSFDDGASDNPYSEAARVIASAIRGTTNEV